MTQRRHDEPAPCLGPVGERARVGGHDPSGLFVLVVEDHEETAHDGHEARVAFDGPTALRSAQEFQPDVILPDIGLPRMDGYDVASSCIRPRRTSAVHCSSLSSGWGRRSDRRRSDEAGIDLHLVKPIDSQQLCGIPKRFHRLLAEPSH